MKGYSYYPVDLTGSLTLKGDVALYNAEFDATETGTTDNRLTTEQSQHYIMHNSLFRNVSGTLNTDLKLNGNVRKIGDYCGGLIMGTVSSTSSGKPATINVNSLLLNGVNIASAEGPLLINKAGSNATLNISNVSNNDSSYVAVGAGASTPSYIATSLLGDIGNSDASAVKLTFSGIKLDGRSASGVTNLPGLTSVYHSKGSLFSNATLVNKLEYKANTGSFGLYNYGYTEDWGTETPRNVTYGAEITDTVENRDSSNNSKQTMYNTESGVGDYYTRPDYDLGGANALYSDFGTYFQKYVNEAYIANGTKHELRVNLRTVTTLTGCGTYNDPYLM